MYILYIIMLNFFIFIYIKISILTHIYYFILKLHEICQKNKLFFRSRTTRRPLFEAISLGGDTSRK